MYVYVRVCVRVYARACECAGMMRGTVRTMKKSSLLSLRQRWVRYCYLTMRSCNHEFYSPYFMYTKKK
jgi:hypothetical protein